ncbi:hypothetical protein JCM8097_002164 [Rhodosporidiobolus ruineniae]
MQGPRFPSHSTRPIPNLVPPSLSSTASPSHLPPSSSRGSDLELEAASLAVPLKVFRPPTEEQADTGQGGGEAARGGQGVNDGSRERSNDADLEAAKADPPLSRNARVFKVLKKHLAFVGPGVIASVAYLDPGNWATDLQAGSAYGYSHLFIILFAGLIALLFQILSTRLGCVTDYDLATQCRFALYDRPGRYKLFYRYGLLWPLYFLAEAGIIFTDLAELLGSAIAINLLIPAIPLWGAVLLTSLDVFLVLLLFNQYPTRTVTASMRMFELLIGLLVLVVLGSFVALLVKVSPVWAHVFKGYVPSSGIVRGGGIYIAVGIVGATVMPHAFYIGSKMATMRRLKPSDYGESDDTAASPGEDDFAPLSPSLSPADEPIKPSSSASPRGRSRDGPAPRPFFPSLHMPQPLSLNGAGVGFNLNSLSRARSRSNSPAPGPARRDEIEELDEVEAVEDEEDAKKAPMDELATPPLSSTRSPTHPFKRPRLPSSSHSQSSTSARAHLSSRAHPSRPKPTLACIEAHLNHQTWDIVGSLLGFAVVVNSSILILAAAVVHYGPYKTTNPNGVSDLFDAYDIIKDYLGQGLAYLFAVALLMAGQSASLTVTLSGQIVSEGFINWRTKPWKRRLITRIINIVPSLAVAAAVGRSGIDTLLVASQVALSIVLTFVLMPLIIFTSQHSIMAVPLKPSSLPADAPPAPAPAPSPPLAPTSTPTHTQRLTSFLRAINPLRRRSVPAGHASYANPVALIWLCGALWLLIGIANVYALYDVGAGKG